MAYIGNSSIHEKIRKWRSLGRSVFYHRVRNDGTGIKGILETWWYLEELEDLGDDNIALGPQVQLYFFNIFI